MIKVLVNVFDEPPVAMPHAPDLYVNLTGNDLNDILDQIRDRFTKKQYKTKPPYKLQIFIEASNG